MVFWADPMRANEQLCRSVDKYNFEELVVTLAVENKVFIPQDVIGRCLIRNVSVFNRKIQKVRPTCLISVPSWTRAHAFKTAIVTEACQTIYVMLTICFGSTGAVELRDGCTELAWSLQQPYEHIVASNAPAIFVVINAVGFLLHNEWQIIAQEGEMKPVESV